MFKKTIHKQVMKVIKDRINAVQEQHDKEVEALDIAHKDNLLLMEEAHTNRKNDITRRHVDSILSKIL